MRFFGFEERLLMFAFGVVMRDFVIERQGSYFFLIGIYYLRQVVA